MLLAILEAARVLVAVQLTVHRVHVLLDHRWSVHIEEYQPFLALCVNRSWTVEIKDMKGRWFRVTPKLFENRFQTRLVPVPGRVALDGLEGQAPVGLISWEAIFG